VGKLEAIFMGRNQDLSWPIISRRSRVFGVPSKDCFAYHLILQKIKTVALGGLFVAV